MEIELKIKNGHLLIYEVEIEKGYAVTLKNSRICIKIIRIKVFNTNVKY